MTEQLALLDVPTAARPLTDRQQAALDAVRQAGPDGLHTEELGALLCSLKESRWRHHQTERCLYCGKTGFQMLNALRTRGLVKYRARLKTWVTVDAVESTLVLPGMLPDDAPLPF